ncbi:hypothetical protein [Synoicihabitans lomoniglobus]|uniref:Hemolytic protein HlpA-like protein n=1 Tax=Synoicihabitans lomoniglobus TaxID=2909285 RepID=A0AAF0CSP0_9BACT|nr:hypothetical protein [Opitutaceae bacterium LMO-M01]WED67281.1 hypothetical protein PXH66_10510 [Opitutaceae bacterium LMO-M01]
MKTAVALIIFNRPEVTRRTLAAIREARPPVLLVIADGPRIGRDGEAEKCAEVRALVEAGVNWPCEVETNYADKNLGCARRVSSGLNWVFEQVEEAIILEDDCLPVPTFFSFCEELLERYRDDERVAQIAGCSFLPEGEGFGESYFFSRYPHCWGWATWRRAWRHYDHGMQAWEGKREASWKIAPARSAERRLWADCFDATQNGEQDSWAYRWTSVIWSRGMWSANSAVNLVANLGFGGDATHTVTGRWGNLPTRDTVFPLIHPEEVAGNVEVDALIGRLVFEPSPFLLRLIAFARRIIRT